MELETMDVVDLESEPFGRCVPLPPSCIPSEVVIKAESYEQQIYYGEYESGKWWTEIEGTEQEEEQNTQETFKKKNFTASNYRNIQLREPSMPPKVMYNNWIDPDF